MFGLLAKEVFSPLPQLELKTVQSMCNLVRQQRALDPFSTAEANIPFFSEKELPDLRLAAFAPDAPEHFKTHEAQSIVNIEEPLLFRAASGGGKTAAIFDAGCVVPMVYIACHDPPDILA